jgi:nitroreductase
MHRGGTRPPHLGKMRESLATRHVARGTWHVARRMGAIAMETAEGIARLRRLRTVRRFTDRLVPQAVPQAGLDALLSVARWSGSANTRQPWVFSVVRERETRRRLAELAGDVGHLAGAALAIVLVMDGAADQVEQETFDEGVLSQRLQLAAAAHGLGSAIGWFHGEGRQTAKEILGIPRERLVRTALSFGYEEAGAEGARFHPPQARKPLAEIVHYERFGGV